MLLDKKSVSLVALAKTSALAGFFHLQYSYRMLLTLVKAVFLPGIIQNFCSRSMQSISMADTNKVKQLSSIHASIGLPFKRKVIRSAFFGFTGSHITKS